MGYRDKVSFDVLVGKTLIKIEQQDDERILFKCDTGERYVMCHEQDCCESVTIEDINGDLNDLIGSPILKASEDVSGKVYRENYAWTFYNISTIKGTVAIRWYGQSNGYYSESVDFETYNGEWENEDLK